MERWNGSNQCFGVGPARSFLIFEGVLARLVLNV